MNKKTLAAALLSALASLLVFVLLGWLSYSNGWIQFGGVDGPTPEQALGKTKLSTENANFVCEVVVSMPRGDLQAEPEVYSDVVVVGLNYEQKSGWYQGQFSISESRKGSMVLEGSKAVVSRPAMFQRFGEMIIGEDFTFDRLDGAFVQTLTFKGGKRRHILKGTCAKMSGPPF